MRALADGVFAIAMTFLALDVLEVVGEVRGDVPAVLRAATPPLASYGLGFLVLGLFWSGHRIALARLRRTDRRHIWLNVLFLAWVSLIPFPAALLASHYREPAAVLVYGVALTMTAGSLYALGYYAAEGGRLTDGDLPSAAVRAFRRRIARAIALYAVAVGTAYLAAPWAGIAVFVASHLYFAIRPVTEAEAPDD